MGLTMGAVGDATTGAVFGATVVPDGVVNGLIVPVGPVIGMELGAVAGVTTGGISVGAGINNAGQTTGYSYTTGGGSISYRPIGSSSPASAAT